MILANKIDNIIKISQERYAIKYLTMENKYKTILEKGEHIRMYKLKDARAMNNNDTGVKNILFDGIIIGNISFEINENTMHVNDINIDVKYTNKKHATNLLIQLVKEFNIYIIDGTGTYNEGEYFWERLGGKMSEYIYTKNIVDVQGDTPQCCCLGRNFKLTVEQLIKYSKLK